MIDEAGIRALINESGRCSCAGETHSAGMTHLDHRAQMAPMVIGGAHDKMQYEMPSTAAHAEHDAGHAKAMSHAGMDHDMSDPKMAKSMEADMRKRFFVALLLTIPTVLYSPLGADPTPRSASHPRDAGARGGHSPEDHERALGAFLRIDHARYLLARHPGHATRGRPAHVSAALRKTAGRCENVKIGPWEPVFVSGMVARVEGLEPPTGGFGGRCSSN